MEFYIILGVILYLSIALDILQTTLSMHGGGWLTSRTSHFFWKCVYWLSGKDGESKLLGHAGYLLLASIVVVWVFILWLSFSFILYGMPGVIVDSTTKVPADFLELVYYAGFSLSTLGMGDFVPVTTAARILTSFFSFTGLILLTMSVTYFIPVLSAVIEQRKLGIRLSLLGKSPQEIVLNAWNGENFDSLLKKSDELSGSIIKYSQQHRAYPVIHYFHNTDVETTVILQLARLHEALQILSYKIPDEYRPDDQILRPLHKAFENYFKVLLEVTHIKLRDTEPESSNLDALVGTNFFGEQKPDSSVPDKITRHRKFFHSLIYLDGWKWDQVDPKKS
ncbi:potassium channel family protein [Gramella sp. GC03-9]|uniref:Potassium channel family protein n=1 Tax=Christiangramia oceanisediminis TaxID=2920386 RepID=A0A9X2KWN3_9FLAO|nr:potassium channel family protein [Gramella oceanisediminis]MCP9199693.1 potassium channel family protein [Gramella oceanisediminis]